MSSSKSNSYLDRSLVGISPPSPVSPASSHANSGQAYRVAFTPGSEVVIETKLWWPSNETSMVNVEHRLKSVKTPAAPASKVTTVTTAPSAYDALALQHQQQQRLRAENELREQQQRLRELDDMRRLETDKIEKARRQQELEMQRWNQEQQRARSLEADAHRNKAGHSYTVGNPHLGSVDLQF